MEEQSPLISSGISNTSYRPQPWQPSRKKDHRKFVVACILVTELCERLTYYSITANLVLYFTNYLNYSSSTAVTIQYVFTGSCYFIPLLGGWISDAIAGRFNVIFGSGLIYCIGAILLPVVSFDYTKAGINEDGEKYGLGETEMQIFFLVGLALVAIGTGGIKANVGPYGAEQIEDLGGDAVQSFFNWFYWFINVGSAIAFSFVAYLQQNVSFSYGFLVPAISMVVSVIVFAIGRNLYKEKPPGGSVLTTTANILVEGVKRKRQGIYDLPSFLDHAKHANGGSYSEEEVEGVKKLGKIMLVFLMLIFYWTVYAQMQTTFLLQGVRMNLGFATDSGFKIPAASLSLFNTLIILILVPLMDKIVYPVLAKYDKSPSLLVRIGIGMFLAALSVVVAGILEIYRKEDLQEHGGKLQDVAGTIYNASDLSIFLQIPQFALIGASEVFASVAGLEFAYSEAPQFLQGLIMGICLLTTGLGNYLGSAVLAIVESATADRPWVPSEINDGYIEYFFFLLGGLMGVNFIVFVLMTWCCFSSNKKSSKDDSVKYESFDKSTKSQTRMAEQNSRTDLKTSLKVGGTDSTRL